MKCLLILSVLLPFSSALAVFDVSSPTTGWTPISYLNNDPDPTGDEQATSFESDIVGNAAHPSAYTKFDNGGTPSLTDGTLGFRLRLGGDKNNNGFQAAIFFGFDADGNGSLDLFVGLNNSGSNADIRIWDPGTGTNTSPSTTSVTPSAYVYSETASNYLWTPVTTTNDPSVGTFTDIDGGTSGNDYFATFTIPFADIIARLTARGISGIDENSNFRYVVATSTQGNSLNQDLNGLPKVFDANATWTSLGATSLPISVTGVLVPEPSTWGLVLAGSLGLVFLQKSRRKA